MKKHHSNGLLFSLLPVLFLIVLLAYNIFFNEGEWLGTYSNQFILLLSAGAAFLIGYFFSGQKKVAVFSYIFSNLKGVYKSIIILALVGALSGAWLVGGIIPSMVYYGLSFLTAPIFLPACVLIAIVISIFTGSSWTTSATVGLALIGVGTVLGIPKEMIAGAVISGAYFGDKMSPLSDTTNLAPAMAGTDIYTHIKYMLWTTLPSILIAFVFFIILGANLETQGAVDLTALKSDVTATFHITPYLFLVPFSLVVVILLTRSALFSLVCGIVFGLVASVFYQPNVLANFQGVSAMLFDAILTDVKIPTTNKLLQDLFVSGGMLGMLWTILLIVAAMIFGGVMQAMGFLQTITAALLSLSKNIFGLFTSTVAACLGINILTSDQYLSIVLPGKMFKEAYREKGLAPENLSRTLEDTGTVTSVLIPWNTCGAYQSEVLGVGTFSYAIYAVFNWFSPFVTLTFALFRIKIKMMTQK